MLWVECRGGNCFLRTVSPSERSQEGGVIIIHICRKYFPAERDVPTYGCVVVEPDVLRWKSPLPDDELIKGARDVVPVRSAGAGPDDEVRVGVAVVLGDVAARNVTISERPVDVDLQTVLFSPGEEDVRPVRPCKRNDVTDLHHLQKNSEF